MDIHQHLGEELANTFEKASEAYIAVALAKEYSLDLLRKASRGCKVKMIVGVNLPTSIEVLCELNQRYSSEVRIYRAGFFHPKVYLFRMKDNSWIAYIGSANFTDAGLHSNIELSVAVKDQTSCEEILNWFNALFEKSEPITEDFLAEYAPYTKKWAEINRELPPEFQMEEEGDSFIKQRVIIERELRRKRKEKVYEDICSDREEVVAGTREAIDYDHDFQNIDVSAFLNIRELGSIRRVYTKQLKSAANNGDLRKLFKYLCNERIPLEKRMEECISGKYRVVGCGKNILTKVLTIHKPQCYVVYNNVTKWYLDSVGIDFPRGLSFPKQYIQVCKIFSEICIKIDIKDLTVLDALLFNINREQASRPTR